MSGGAINLRLSELRCAAPQFSSTADAVNAVHQRLQSSLAAEEGCWGSGDIGIEFASHYVAHAEQGMANLGTLADALKATARAVLAAANAFEQTEQHNAATFIGPVASR